jgi:hypothetical protein
VARILAVAPDLMFASRIEATLGAAGHDVALASSLDEAPALEAIDLLVVDLDREQAEAAVGLGVPVLGFYAHLNVETREEAEAAGVDLVVPRSRMAREMPELAQRLLVS